MALEIFRRKEQKYLISSQQYLELVDRMQPYMRPDKYGVDGKYTISSLYFESPDRKIYYETKNKLKFRQKLDRKSTRLNSSHVAISYAVFCLKKKNKQLNMTLSIEKLYT